ncbi:hypothetical protein [Streptomyces sp. URMC 124]|uniref:hypothetical protein n=1 Tax=Streptomyces sp. URMC 124 TaxID=3423405 RepID=UPI003F1C782D
MDWQDRDDVRRAVEKGMREAQREAQRKAERQRRQAEKRARRDAQRETRRRSVSSSGGSNGSAWDGVFACGPLVGLLVLLAILWVVGILPFIFGVVWLVLGPFLEIFF